MLMYTVCFKDQNIKMASFNFLRRQLQLLLPAILVVTKHHSGNALGSIPPLTTNGNAHADQGGPGAPTKKRREKGKGKKKREEEKERHKENNSS